MDGGERGGGGGELEDGEVGEGVGMDGSRGRGGGGGELEDGEVGEGVAMDGSRGRGGGETEEGGGGERVIDGWIGGGRGGGERA